MAPRQNAGGLSQRMRDGACALETHKPHGKRHGQAAEGKQTLPLFGPKMRADRVLLRQRGSGVSEVEGEMANWALAEDGL